MNMIESHRSTPAFTDREIIDAILKNVMLEEEAQNRGIHVTEKDVEAFLASTVYASYEMEEGKASIDAYCEDAGLTFDEYVASVREAAPSIIRKAKLERDIAETYCKEHSLVFDERNPSQEIRDAVKEEENAIFEAHKHEIQYFVKWILTASPHNAGGNPRVAEGGDPYIQGRFLPKTTSVSWTRGPLHPMRYMEVHNET